MYPDLHIFGMHISTYNIMMILASLIGAVLVVYQLKQLKYSYRDQFTLIVIMAVGGICGARALNYVVNYQNYLEADKTIIVWEWSGFSLYGGVVGVVIMTLLFCKLAKKNIWLLADRLWMPFGIGFIVMRMGGCLLNGCCYGHYTKSFVGIPLPESRQKKSCHLSLVRRQQRL